MSTANCISIILPPLALGFFKIEKIDVRTIIAILSKDSKLAAESTYIYDQDISTWIPILSTSLTSPLVSSSSKLSTPVRAESSPITSPVLPICCKNLCSYVKS